MSRNVSLITFFVMRLTHARHMYITGFSYIGDKSLRETDNYPYLEVYKENKQIQHVTATANRILAFVISNFYSCPYNII